MAFNSPFTNIGNIMLLCQMQMTGAFIYYEKVKDREQRKCVTRFRVEHIDTSIT